MYEANGKDTTFLEPTKIRLNGMVRHNRVWQPIDAFDLDSNELFGQVLQERSRVGTKWPSYEWAEVTTFRKLHHTHRKAVEHYLTSHGVVVPRGDMELTIGVVRREKMQQYLGEIASQQGYDGWDDYHAWYVENLLTDEGRGVPAGSAEVWPVIISDFADEGIQDGSHRLHYYMKEGLGAIPFVAFPYEMQQVSRIVKSWRLRKSRVLQLAGA